MRMIPHQQRRIAGSKPYRNRWVCLRPVLQAAARGGYFEYTSISNAQCDHTIQSVGSKGVRSQSSRTPNGQLFTKAFHVQRYQLASLAAL